MKRNVALALGGVSVVTVVGGLYAIARKKTAAAKPLPSKSTPIVPPPPDAVWLKPLPNEPQQPLGPSWLEQQGPNPSGGAGGAGGAPTAGTGGTGGASPTGSTAQGSYILTGAGGVVLELDAGKFLSEKFSPLPEDQRPTNTQARRIYDAFSAMGVETNGKLRVRPSPDAVNATLDLASAFDLEKAPAPVGAAVREFAKLAWQLPISLERKA